MSIEPYKKRLPFFPYTEPISIIVRRPTGRILNKELVDPIVYAFKKKPDKISKDKIIELENRVEELELNNKKLLDVIHSNDVIIKELNQTINKLEALTKSNLLSERLKGLEYQINMYKLYCIKENKEIHLIACGRLKKDGKCVKDCLGLNNFLIKIGLKDRR